MTKGWQRRWLLGWMWSFLVVLIANYLVVAQEEPSAAEAAAVIERAMVDVIAKTEKSVVAISRIRRDEAVPQPMSEFRGLGEMSPLVAANPLSPDFVPREFCSGVVIDRSGLILTVLHGLGEISRSDYVVWRGQRPYAAKVKAADPWLNVAVLQIAADDLTPISLGDAKTLAKGQVVVSLGNPYALARDGRPSAGWTMIANLSRPAPPPKQSKARGGRETLHHFGTLIETDARTPVGTCGGALVNLQGELVGLTTTWTGTAEQEEAAGLAIPIDADFQKALEELKGGRLPDYGFLGIAPTALPLIERQAGRTGVVVDDVVPGTPAAKAGLKPGDIITHVAGHAIHDDVELIRYVSAQLAETQLEVTLLREPQSKKPMQIPVVLSKKLPEAIRESFAEQSPAAWRGMKVEYATATPYFRELARQMDPQGCIAVVQVDRDSLAWKAGLRPGQFISHVGEKRVGSPQEFFTAIAGRNDEVALRLTFSTDGKLSRNVLTE